MGATSADLPILRRTRRIRGTGQIIRRSRRSIGTPRCLGVLRVSGVWRLGHAILHFAAVERRLPQTSHGTKREHVCVSTQMWTLAAAWTLPESGHWFTCCPAAKTRPLTDCRLPVPHLAQASLVLVAAASGSDHARNRLEHAFSNASWQSNASCVKCSFRLPCFVRASLISCRRCASAACPFTFERRK